MDRIIAQGSILPIVTRQMPLRTVSEPIGIVNDVTLELVADMLATMYAAPGIGLAAIQVGRPLRVIVWDLGTPEARRPEVMIDPVIEWAKKRETEMEEGCLSIPGLRINVSRPSDIRVAYMQIDGTRRVRDLGGLHARVVQHETDHLDGRLITDRLVRT